MSSIKVKHRNLAENAREILEQLGIIELKKFFYFQTKHKQNITDTINEINEMNIN